MTCKHRNQVSTVLTQRIIQTINLTAFQPLLPISLVAQRQYTLSVDEAKKILQSRSDRLDRATTDGLRARFADEAIEEI